MADARDTFAISIGLVPDETNRKVVDKMLDEVRKTLEKEYNLKIDQGDTEAILQNVEKLGVDIKSVINDAGDLTKVTTTFNNMNGAVVTLTTNLSKAVYTLEQFKQMGENLNSNAFRDIYNQGGALDSSGNAVSWQDRGQTAQLVDVGAQSSLTYATQADTMLQNIIDKYKEIVQLTKQLNTTEYLSNSWVELKGRIDQAKSSLDTYMADNSQLLQNSSQLGEITKQYQEQINLINRLSDAKKADKQDKQNESAQEQKIISLLNEQLKVTTELNKTDSTRNANFVKLKQTEKAKLDEQVQGYQKVIDQNEKLSALQQKNQGKVASMQATTVDAQDNKNIEEAIRLKKELAKAEQELYEIQKRGGSDAAYNDAAASVQQLSAALQEATNAELSNTRAAQENGQTVADTSRYREEANRVDEEAIRNQRELDESYQRSTFSLASLGESIKKVAQNVVQYKLVSQVFSQIDNAIVSSVKKVAELDKSMTQIQIVTGQTNEEVRQLMLSYSDLAIELGVTTKQIADGSAEWFRQGRTVAEVNELLKASTVLSVTGNLQAAEATELLTASINGFKLEATEAMAIVDKFVEADLNFATSAGEIATAMQYVAASADGAGISIDKMVGLITTVSQATRLSAETIGNSMKTIIARMQNIKIGKFVSEEFDEPLNDVEKTLNKLGIALRTNEQEWRSMEDVLDEVGARWQEFTEIEQSAIAVALGGTRQRNQLLTIFENYDTVLQATTISMNSAGAAAERYEFQMDSIEAKINQLIATWEKMVNNFNAGGAFKNIIDLATKLVEILDFLINKMHILEGLTFIGVLSGLKLIYTNVVNLVNGIKNVTAAMTAMKAVDAASTTADLAASVANLTTNQAALVLMLKGATTAQIAETLQTRNATAADIEHAIAAASASAAVQGQTLANGLATFSFQALAASVWSATQAVITFLATNPVGWAILAVGAIVGIVAIFNELTVTLEEQREKVAELKAEYDELAGELEGLQGELERTQKRIAELQKQETLTLVEQDELKALKESNAELELRIKLLEREEEIAARKLRQSQIELWDKSWGMANSGIVTQDSIDNLNVASTNFVTSKAMEQNKDAYTIQNLLYLLDDFKNKYAELLADENASTKELEKQQGLIETTSSILLERYNSYLEYYNLLKNSNAESEKEQQILAESISALTYISEAMGMSAEWKNLRLSDIFNAEELSGFKNELDAINESFANEEITLDQYNDKINKIFQDLINDKQKLNEAGISELFTEEELNNVEQFKASLMEAFGVIPQESGGVRAEIESLDAVLKQMDDATISAYESMKEYGDWLSTLEDNAGSAAQAVEEFQKVQQKLNSAIEFGQQVFDQYNDAIQNDIAAMEELHGVVGSLAEGNAMAGTELQDFMNKIAAMPDVIDPITETTFSLYDNLAAYINETSDATFQNGEVIVENFEAYKEAALNKIEAEKKVLEQNREASIQILNNNQMWITDLKAKLGSIPIIGDALSKAFESLETRIFGDIDAQIQAINDDFDKQIEKVNIDKTAIESLGMSFGTTYANGVAKAKDETKKLDEATKQLISDLQSARSDIESLLSAAMSMIKQEYADQKAALQDQLNDLTDRYNKEKDYLDNLKKAKDDAYNREKDRLNSIKDQIKKRYDAEKKELKAQYDARKKNYDAEKKAIQDEMNARKKAYDAIKKQMKKELDERTKAYNKQKKELQALQKEQKTQHDELIKQLKTEQDARNKMYNDQKSALKEQLAAQRELINAELELLKRKEEQRNYDKEVEKKTNNLAKLQNDLAMLENDNSIEAQRKKLELISQIAKAQEELDEYQHERGVDLQEQALQDEMDRFENQINDKIDQIQREQDKYQELYDQRIEQLTAEQDKFNDNIQEQIDALDAEMERYREQYDAKLEMMELEYETWREQQEAKLEILNQEWDAYREWYDERTARLQAIYDAEMEQVQGRLDALSKEKKAWDERHARRLASLKAEYEAQKANLDKQIKDIDDYVSKESNIRKEAIELIEGRSKEFYDRLIAWNKEYGTGVDADVTKMWNAAYSALERFGGSAINVQGTLESIATQMYSLQNAAWTAAAAFANTAASIRDAAMALAMYNALGGNSKGGKNVNDNPNTGGVPYFHTGAKQVMKTPTPYDQALGVKPNEQLAIVEVGETILKKGGNMSRVSTDNMAKDFDPISDNIKSLAPVSATGDFAEMTFNFGDINIENGDREEADQLKKGIIDEVFSRISKQTKRSGFGNVKVLSVI